MYEYKVKQIKKVVDGDTLYLITSLGFYITYLVKLRIEGIDTPEMYGRVDEAEKIEGLKCRDYAASILENHIMGGYEMIVRTTGKPDKYGRWLGDVLLRGGPYGEEGMLFGELMKQFMETEDVSIHEGGN